MSTIIHLMQLAQRFKTYIPTLNHSEASLFYPAGDYRQTLTIIPNGTSADKLNACLKNSHPWRSVQSRMSTIIMHSIPH